MKKLATICIAAGLTGMLTLNSCQKENLTPAGTATTAKAKPARAATEPKEYQRGFWIFYNPDHYECAPIYSYICYVIIRPKISSQYSPDEILAISKNSDPGTECTTPEEMNAFVNATDPQEEELWLVPGGTNPQPQKIRSFNAYYNESDVYSVDVTLE